MALAVLAACGGGGGHQAPAPAVLTGRALVDGAQTMANSVASVHGDEDFLCARDLGTLGLDGVDIVGRLDETNPRDCVRMRAAGVSSVRLQLVADGAVAAVHRLGLEGLTATPEGVLGQGRSELGLLLADGEQLLLIVESKTPSTYRLRLEGVPEVAAVIASTDDLTKAATMLDAADPEIEPGALVILGGAVNPHEVASCVGKHGFEVRGAGGGSHHCAAIRGAALQSGRAGKLALAQAMLRLRHALPVGAAVEPSYVVHAAQNQRTPNDPSFDQQWAHRLTNARRGWATTTGSSIVVAVVDTGIRSRHPDLAANVLAGGYDFVDGDSDPEDPLVSGASMHGSHVAGIVAAVTNNGVGVAGVGWNTKVLPVRVLGASGGTSFAVTQGVLYAAGLPNSSGRVPPQRARVINMSLGSTSNSSAIHDAIRQARAAGAIVVVAAGNDALRGNPVSYPAAHDEVIAVGAVGPSGARAPYSGFQPYVDLAAPGGDTQTRSEDGILSTVSVERSGSWYFDYRYLQGTSMAAPYVAGTIALMLAANSSLDHAQVMSILARTAGDRGARGHDPEYGAGLLDVGEAVAEAVRGGGGGGGNLPSPRVDRTALLFSQAGTLAAAITSDGASPVTGLVVSVSGGNWLAANLDSTTTPAQLRVSVDGTAFGSTTREGRVSVRSASGAAVEVVVRAVTLRVVLIAESGQSSSVQPQNGAFSLSGVMPGNCRIQAGVDSDGNGSLQDPGDYASDPLPVVVTPGAVLDVGVLTARRR